MEWLPLAILVVVVAARALVYAFDRPSSETPNNRMEAHRHAEHGADRRRCAGRSAVREAQV